MKSNLMRKKKFMLALLCLISSLMIMKGEKNKRRVLELDPSPCDLSCKTCGEKTDYCLSCSENYSKIINAEDGKCYPNDNPPENYYLEVTDQDSLFKKKRYFDGCKYSDSIEVTNALIYGTEVKNSCDINYKKIKTKKIIYASDGVGLTLLQIAAFADGNEVLSDSIGPFYDKQDKKEFVLDDDEFFTKIGVHKNANWITAIHVFTTKKDLVLGEHEKGDEHVEFSFKSELVGFDAVTYVNGFASIKFMYVTNCELQCHTCTEISICIDCESNYYYKEDEIGKCIKEPSHGYFINGRKIQKCHESCDGCILHQHNCLKCASDFFPLYDDFPTKCFKMPTQEKENIGIYFDKSSNYFKNCNEACKYCNNDTNICLECNLLHYNMENTTEFPSICYNSSNYSKGYYVSIKDNAIKPCDKSCSSCKDWAENCLECAPNYFMKKDVLGACMNEAPEGYYLDKKIVPYVYNICNISCKACIRRSTNCLVCSDGFYNKIGLNNVCYDGNDRIDGFYLSTSDSPITFKPCDSSCKKCPIEGGSCIECADGYYFKSDAIRTDYCYKTLPSSLYFFDEKNMLYGRCGNNCASCDEAGDMYCTECINGYFYIEENFAESKGPCFKDNPGDGYYFENSQNIFKKCLGNCLNCINGNDDGCTSCKTTTYPIKTDPPVKSFECYNSSSPPSNHFLDSQINFFVQCDSSCKTCDTSDICLTCADNYFKIRGNPSSLCFKKDNLPTPNLYFDSDTSEFNLCYISCRTCNTYGTDKCTSCQNKNGYYFKEKEEFYIDDGYDFLLVPYKLPEVLEGVSRVPSEGECYNKSIFLNDNLNFATEIGDENIFKKCTPNCASCKYGVFENDCTRCNNGYRFKAEDILNTIFTCYLSPPDYYFVDENESFSLFFFSCFEGCKKCVGGQKEECSECREDYYLLESTSFPAGCYNSVTGHYLSDNVFKKCDISCAECKTDKDNCLSCNGGSSYYHKEEDISSTTKKCYHFEFLIEKYYFSEDLFYKCSPNCLQCAGIDEDKCKKCIDQTYPTKEAWLNFEEFSTPFKCYDKNPAINYFLNMEKLYEECDKSCLSCNNGLSNSCLTCNIDHYFISGYNENGDICYNVNYPPGEYFLKDNLFQKCDSTCKKCVGEKITECSECADNYYFIESISTPSQCYNESSPPGLNYILLNNLFKKCTDNCGSCFAVATDKCKTCSENAYFKIDYNQSTGDTCYTTKPGMFFLDSDKLYKPCDVSCLDCAENSLKCLECNSDMEYYNKLTDNIISDECYFTKPEFNYYLDYTSNTYLWKKCSENCAICYSYGNVCSKCADNYFTLSINIYTQVLEFPCFNTPPEGYYKNNNMYDKCTSGCQTCLSDGIVNCSTCDNSISFFAYELNDYTIGGECFDKQPEINTYLDIVNKMYKICHNTCAICREGGDTKCLECISGYNFRFDANKDIGDKCYNDKPLPNMYLDDTEKVYKMCNESCSFCDKGSDKCLECAENRYFKSGYNISGDICYSSIPASDFYLDTSKKLYEQCYTNCGTCDEYGSDKCKTCKNEYYYKDGDTLPNECHNDLNQTNYYLDIFSQTYKLCHSNCSTCDGPNIKDCLTCVLGYYFKSSDSIPNECYNDIFSEGYYIDIDNNLWIKCASNCSTCENGTDSGCVKCAENHYFKENNINTPNKCYLNKPDTFYYFNKDENLFKLCSLLCKSCNEYGDDKCTECISSSFTKEEDSNNSVFNCYDNKPNFNYYLDSSGLTSIYKKCGNTCYSCDLGKDLCTVCNVGYYFKENFNIKGDTCYNTLPSPNYYLDKEENLYIKCNEACETCVGKNNTDCMKCKNGYYKSYLDILPPMGCYNNFVTNSYLDISNIEIPIWRLCHATCATCRNGGVSNCDTCIDNYYFIIGYVGDGNRCFNKKPYTNFYLETSEKIWKACYFNCDSCNFGNEDSCLSCRTDTFFIFNHNILGDFCYEDLTTSNYYFDSVNSVFKLCDKTCGTCDGPDNTQCLTCSKNHYQVEGETGSYKKCFTQSDLPFYYIDTETQTFKPCSDKCNTCANSGTSNCLSCRLGLFLKDTYDTQNGGTCYNDYPAENYYLDLVSNPSYYKLCYENCKTCLAGEKDKCQSCAENYAFLENYNSKIGDTCYEIDNFAGHYYHKESNIFKSCSPNCNSCSTLGNDKCIQCSEEHFFIFNAILPNKCYINAPSENYYLDKSFNEKLKWTWKVCHDSCKTCTFGKPCSTCDKGDESSCLSCADNFYFKEGYNNINGDSCYNSNPPNYYLDKTTETFMYKKCSDNCATCEEKGKNKCLSCIPLTHFKKGYQENGDECHSENFSGYYLDIKNPVNDKKSNDLYFQPCDVTCNNCSGKGANNCTECVSGKTFIKDYSAAGDICYDIDSPFIFLDRKTNEYKNCDVSCNGCLSEAYLCTECATSHYIKNDDMTNEVFKCYTELDSHYLSKEYLAFIPCKNPYCKSCLPGSAKCTSCIANYYFIEGYDVSEDDCYEDKNLPGIYYLDENTKLYTLCHESCYKCINKDKNSCTYCPSGEYLAILNDSNKSGECKSIVPDGYYVDKVERTINKCHVNCFNCNGPNDFNCLSCINNSYLINGEEILGGVCHGSTPEFHFLDNSTTPSRYTMCSYNCYSCVGPKDNQCLECTYGFNAMTSPDLTSGVYCGINLDSKIYDISNSELSNGCSENCSKCIDNKEDKCIECKSGFYFLEDYNKNGDVCYKEKPFKNYYLNTKEQLFKPCHEKCKTCENFGIDKCTSCIDNYYLKENHNKYEGDYCYKDSPLNYYLDRDLGIYKYCNFNSGSQYLELDESTKNIECRSLSMIDFSVYDYIEIPEVKIADSKKYTIQFWFKLMGFDEKNNKNTSFKSREIIWDLHAKIKILSINNQLFVECYPIFDVTNSNMYGKMKLDINMNTHKGDWIRVNCAVDLVNSRFDLNGQEKTFDLKQYNGIPDLESSEDTKLIIRRGEESPSEELNDGFFFIKDLKLWNNYNTYPQDCSIQILQGANFSNINFLNQLVFYFENNQYSLNLINLSDSLSYRNNSKISSYNLEKFMKKDFKGYKIVNYKINMENHIEFPKLNTCMNLIISPNSGIISETIFTVTVLRDYVSSISLDKFYYTYYLNEKKYTEKIVNNSSNNLITFKINIDFINKDEIPNPLLMEIYGEVINSSGKKEILSNQINLYISKISHNFNELVESILRSYDNTEKLTASDKENLSSVLDHINHYNELFGIKSNEAYSSPVMNEKGLLTYEEKDCPVNFCNGNGECIFLETNNYCYCNNGYAGKRCQFTEKNHNLLKNYFKTLTHSLLSEKSHKKENIIVNVHNHLKSSQNLLDEIEDLNNYVILLENIITEKKTKNSFDDEKSNLIMNILNNILSMTEQNIIKSKIDNYEKKTQKRLIVNFKKIKNEKQMKNDGSNHRYLNSLNDLITKTNKFRYLSSGNFTTENQIDNKENNENKLDYEFFLDAYQKENFKNEIANIKKNIIILGNQILNSNNSNSTMKLSNDNFDVFAFKITLDDIIDFKTEQFFIERMLKKNSYFDISFTTEKEGNIKNCTDKDIKAKLKEILSKNLISNKFNIENCSGNLNLIYLYNKNPSFNLEYSIVNNSLTSSHTIKLFDCKGNEIKISDLTNTQKSINIKIEHFLPILTKNKDFIDVFNRNPYDFLTINNEFSNTFTPLYISANGTIDKNPDMNYQINKYHKNFKIRILNSVEKLDARSISKSGYLIGESNSFGEFFSSIEANKPNQAEGNLFFLRYPNIFFNSENYLNNRCFQVLIILFLLNIILVSFSLIFKKLRNKDSKELKELYEKEKILVSSDENIFGQYFNKDLSVQQNISRYQFSGISFDKINLDNNADKTFVNKNIASDKILNDSKNDSSKKKENDMINVEIELHVSAEGNLEANKMEIINEENNYRVIQHTANVNTTALNYQKTKLMDEKTVIVDKSDIADKEKEKIPYNMNKDNEDARKKDDENNDPSNQATKELEIKEINNSSSCFTGRLRAFLIFAFKRNIYSNSIFMNSVFAPRFKHITKVFTLVYLLCNTTAILTGLSDIDLKEDSYTMSLVSVIFVSIFFSNFVFAIINIIYSSIYQNQNIQEVIKSDFAEEKM